MQKEFVTYEQSLALKELGFYEHCMGFYYYAVPELRWVLQISSDYHKIVSIIDAPLKQQVFRWFREKYGLQAYLTNFLEMCSNNDATYHVVVDGYWYPQLDNKDYEKAENACIDKLIEIAKQQDNENQTNN
jgi:hypothetical protein